MNNDKIRDKFPDFFNLKNNENRVFFIGVSAKNSGKRSGKDTFADTFVDTINNLGYEWIRVVKRSLADSLKEACGNIFLLSKNQLYGDDKEALTDWEWPTTSDNKGKMRVRQILQWFGTEIMRDSWQSDIWLENIRKWGEIEQKKNPSQPLFIVISDIRYANEAKAMDILIDIYNPYAASLNKDEHVSELSAKKIPDEWYDFIFENNESRDVLLDKTRKFAISFFEKLPIALFDRRIV